MRIVVCVKQVPEVSELELDPATRRLRREGVPLMLNPFDRRAMLEAVRLREEAGGTVVALSMGPPQTADALRECLSLGADEAVHLCDPRFAGADTLATSRALADALRRIGFDLVLAGRFSIDSETGQVGPEVAELLGVPCASGVRRLTLRTEDAGTVLQLECERDDGYADVECPLPAVVTCTDRWKTRVPVVVPDEEAAQSRPLHTWTREDLGNDPARYGERGSPTWVEEVQAVASQRERRLLTTEEGIDDAVRAVLDEIAALRERAAREERRHALAHARRDDPRGAIWVLAERAHDGRLRSTTAELLAAADRLAARLGVGVCAYVVAPDLPAEEHPVSNVEALATELGHLGADVLLRSSTQDAPSEARQLADLAAAVQSFAPRIVLAPASGLGRELVPRLAARLGLGLTGDALGVELDEEGRLRQLKPAFGGQFVAPVLSHTRPEMVTVRPGMLEPAQPQPERGAATIVALPVLDVAPSPRRVVRFTPELSASVDLDAASLVVCVGFGAGPKERMPQIEALASALGGVVAGTRRVCDLGWLPRQLQVGISGRSVAPALYLALGVRGSFNHMVGLQRARRVIAVNRDPRAEIFAGADLGVVADAPSFVDALLARLGERNGG
ncbi:MAG TPA: FAD-binding protein [Candidatus Binatia bacterium]